MVAALYQSRPRKDGGTRSFSHQGVEFGWSVIEDMYQREVERKKISQCARIPKLKPNHIYRDAWTRLNVLPSKVMQVCEHAFFLFTSIQLLFNTLLFLIVAR